MRRLLRVILASVAVLVVSPVAPSTAADPASSLEAEVFALVNDVRSPNLVLHSGLREQARRHSESMAKRDSLDHDGASSRPTRAAPDPPEGNGAPDDGHRPPSSSCENVAYVSPGNSDAASKIVRMWRDSPRHNECLHLDRVNVGAVGAFHDGSRWWATFISMTDTTPPGSKASSSGPKASDPKKTSKPAPEAKAGGGDADAPVAAKSVERIQTPEPSQASGATERGPGGKSRAVTETAEKEPAQGPREEFIAAAAPDPLRAEPASGSQRLLRLVLQVVIVFASAGIWATWRTRPVVAGNP